MSKHPRPNRSARLPKPLLIFVACAAATLVVGFSVVAGGAQNKKTADEKKTDKKTALKVEGEEPPDTAQDDVVRLRADLVVVTVTVTDAAGKYVHGLTEKDFFISEDNAPQKTHQFFAEEEPFAAAILFDMSGSMGHKFSLVRAAAANFVERIRDDDQVAVYGFNTKVKLFQEFTNVRDITEYIWETEARDMTSMYDGISEATEALGKRAERRRAILLISDGCDTSSRKATHDSALKQALATGVNIYSVDLTDTGDLSGTSQAAAELRRGRGEMQNFARETGAQYLNSPQGDKLEEAFNNIIEELRNQYTLTYYSTNEKRDGKWRKLTITTSNPRLTVRARRGYFAPKG